MRLFDLVDMQDSSLAELAPRLGFKKIFSAGADFVVTEKAEGEGKRILLSDDFQTVSRALKQGGVVGIMPKNTVPSNKVLDAVKNYESTVFVPLSRVTCVDHASRVQQLVKMRNLARNLLRSKTQFALISFASDKHGIMSSEQMIEVAEFLGIPRQHAKEAMGRLGDLV